MTLAAQRKIYRDLPASKKAELVRVCKTCDMGGDGWFSSMVSMGAKVLGNKTVQTIGKKVLTEAVLPVAKAKWDAWQKEKAKKAGSGLMLSGTGSVKLSTRKKK